MWPPTDPIMRSVGWYVGFGAAHEAAHVAAAALVGRLDGALDGFNLLRAILARHVFLPGVTHPDCPPWAAAVVRHAGWAFSVAVAIVAIVATRPPPPIPSPGRRGKNAIDRRGIQRRSDAAAAMVLAALVTALDGIVTDLLGWGPAAVDRAAGGEGAFGPGEGDPSRSIGDRPHAGSVAAMFFCGNFGGDDEAGTDARFLATETTTTTTTPRDACAMRCITRPTTAT